MLWQLNNEGDEDVVIFISRTLKGSEIYYFTTEKELLAVVWALNKLDTYLKGAVGITIRKEPSSLEERICLARDTMHRKIKGRAAKQNENIKHFTFNEGDAVLVRANNVSSDKHIAKFFSVYEGPYYVKERIGKDTYLLKHNTAEIRGMFHLSNLKPYRSRSSSNNEEAV